MKTETKIKMIFQKYSMKKLCDITGIKISVLQMYRKGQLGILTKYVPTLMCAVPSKSVLEKQLIERVTEYEQSEK